MDPPAASRSRSASPFPIERPAPASTPAATSGRDVPRKVPAVPSPAKNATSRAANESYGTFGSGCAVRGGGGTGAVAGGRGAEAEGGYGGAAGFPDQGAAGAGGRPATGCEHPFEFRFGQLRRAAEVGDDL